MLQPPDHFDFFAGQRPREHAIIRANKNVICSLHGKGPALAAHAGPTTATCTVPLGKYRQAVIKENAPARMSPGGISCVMSTMIARGLIPSTTAFIVPTNQSLVPKSMVSVIIRIEKHL
jgi:hypothetical protein